MTVLYTPGALTKLSIGNTAMAAISCDFGKKGTVLRRPGIHGSREHLDTDARKGPYHCRGSIILEPSPAELVALMALILGAGGAVNDAIPTFAVVVDRVVALGVYTYANCKINRATIHGTQGGVIRADLDVIGSTEVGNSGTVTAPASAAPYIFADGILTLVSASRDMHSFRLEVNNHIDVDRFLNYIYLPAAVELDRTTTLQTVLPWNDANVTLYDQAIAGATGNLAINDGTTGHLFTFGILQVPPEAPAIPGKQEVNITLNMEAVKSGNTPSIAFA